MNLRGTVSWDNVFVETSRGINDLYNTAQTKYIDPETGNITYGQVYESNNKFTGNRALTGVLQVVRLITTRFVRNLYYQLQLNWARKFGQHDVTAMGLFSRQRMHVVV